MLSISIFIHTFLSTLSLRRATQGADSWHKMISISIHALLAESDNAVQIEIVKMYALFLSTLSLRRATSVRPETRQHDAISIHLLGWLRVLISIHALLAESDKTLVILPKELNNFYPRSPCGERLSKINARGSIKIFLSTLSLRRATVSGLPGRLY